ncbi:MAG: ATP-binding cassette domain-containing protein [Candidatus Omnitrophica bacterium]|nr:ATP-binding cassette domain-containing protein [Candidatus Omnitrophota bacterium]
MINFKKINLIYNQKKVIEQLSLNIEKGDKVAILGKSGLGKSSLFYLLLGFIAEYKGEIHFNNIPVNQKTVWDIRKQIAFIDQDVSLGQGKAIDWITSVFAFRANAEQAFRQKQMEELLEYFELSKDDLDKDTQELSGGERQRLAIITAILLNRKVFLFDEITSALDAHLKQKTVDFFIKNKEWTVIAISHDSVWLKNPKVKVFDLEAKSWQQ